MANFLRSTSVVVLLFALASSAGANPPAEITILSFEWREPFAFWFVPDATPTVTTNSLVVALMTDMRATSSRDTPTYTSPILIEGWLWHGDPDVDDGLVW